MHQAPQGLAEEKESKGVLDIVLEGELKPGPNSERTKQIVLSSKTTHGKFDAYGSALESPKSSQGEGMVLCALSLEVWTLISVTKMFQSHSY